MSIYAPVWAIGARYAFNEQITNELKNYVQDGGGLIYIGSNPDSEISAILPAESTQGVADYSTYYAKVTMNHTIIGNEAVYTNFSNFSLRSYEIIQPKLLSDIVAKIGNDPLLMTWQYGLGRTIQFSSDPTSSWASTGNESMLNWSYYRQFWEQCIKWVSRLAVNTRILNVQTEKNFYEVGETIKVDILGTNETGGNKSVSVGITIPSSSRIEGKTFEVDPTSSKKSSFYLVPDVPGEYIIVVTKTINQKSETVSCAVTVLDTIEEYTNPASDFSLLENIANLTDGDVIYSDEIDKIEEIMTKSRYDTKTGKFDLWPYLLVASMGFFFVELGFRWRYI